MMKQVTITSIPDAITALWALNPKMTLQELRDGFDHPREYLDQQPARDWNEEAELKAAYEYGLDLLKYAFAAYVEEFRRKHREFYEGKQ